MKKAEIILTCILAMEAIRFTDDYVLKPCCIAYKRHQHRTRTNREMKLHFGKQVIGFVGKYDTDLEKS